MLIITTAICCLLLILYLEGFGTEEFWVICCLTIGASLMVANPVWKVETGSNYSAAWISTFGLFLIFIAIVTIGLDMLDACIRIIEHRKTRLKDNK
jgi:hypothetical protein